jgi:hypothetical protein
MQSGSPIPVGDITGGQKYYDALVVKTRCTGATDTLQCLRNVPYATLKEAINESPGLFSYQVSKGFYITPTIHLSSLSTVFKSRLAASCGWRLHHGASSAVGQERAHR